jgi:hypothetical protein
VSALFGLPSATDAQALREAASALTRLAAAAEAIRDLLESLTTRLADGSTVVRTKNF